MPLPALSPLRSVFRYAVEFGHRDPRRVGNGQGRVKAVARQDLTSPLLTLPVLAGLAPAGEELSYGADGGLEHLSKHVEETDASFAGCEAGVVDEGQEKVPCPAAQFLRGWRGSRAGILKRRQVADPFELRASFVNASL